jgi:NitT/TauT family transport system substrate-binding protein
MSSQHGKQFSRRRFLRGVTLAGTAGLLGIYPRPASAEPPPETTRIRIGAGVAICSAPQYVAEALLQAEGFTDVQYVKPRTIGALYKEIAAGEADLTIDGAPLLVARIDAGDPVSVLAGLHVGCYDLFGTAQVRSIRDLRGKTVGAGPLGGGRHLFVASIAAYIGLDPRQDIQWITVPPSEARRLFTEGQLDAYMAFPPDQQELQARQIGHIVVSTTVDQPWRQYFCCMALGNREFVRTHPAATKRALRALLKATNICATEPEQAARLLVEKGWTPRYDYALQTLQALPYRTWREYAPEDTIRFYALRLQEAGMITSSPQKIIAQGTDWRFLDALKKEIKG